MVQSRLRYILAWIPRANGYWPGYPRSVSGSKLLRLSGEYRAFTGTPLTVVGGWSRRGTAAFSRSQRSTAERSVAVAMSYLPSFAALGTASDDFIEPSLRSRRRRDFRRFRDANSVISHRRFPLRFKRPICMRPRGHCIKDETLFRQIEINQLQVSPGSNSGNHLISAKVLASA